MRQYLGGRSRLKRDGVRLLREEDLGRLEVVLERENDREESQGEASSERSEYEGLTGRESRRRWPW